MYNYSRSSTFRGFRAIHFNQTSRPALAIDAHLVVHQVNLLGMHFALTPHPTVEQRPTFVANHLYKMEVRPNDSWRNHGSATKCNQRTVAAGRLQMHSLSSTSIGSNLPSFSPLKPSTPLLPVPAPEPVGLVGNWKPRALPKMEAGPPIPSFNFIGLPPASAMTPNSYAPNYYAPNSCAPNSNVHTYGCLFCSILNCVLTVHLYRFSLQEEIPSSCEESFLGRFKYSDSWVVTFRLEISYYF